MDKWDYLARDHYYLGLPNAFDFHIINFVRALNVDITVKNGFKTDQNGVNGYKIDRSGENGYLKHRHVKTEFMICTRDTVSVHLICNSRLIRIIHLLVINFIHESLSNEPLSYCINRISGFQRTRPPRVNRAKLKFKNKFPLDEEYVDKGTAMR